MSSAITKKIKLLSENYINGSELLNLMDYYNVNGLMYISEEQAQAYYKMVIEQRKREKAEAKVEFN